LDRGASSSIGSDAGPAAAVVVRRTRRVAGIPGALAGVVVVRRARPVTARTQTGIVVNESRETSPDLVLARRDVGGGGRIGLARPSL
jgi:hypothetical protein